MQTQRFNAPEILTQLRQKQAIRRRRRFYQSRLRRVRAELVALRQAGGSYRELAQWLHQHHRLLVTHTTIMRYLTQLPECQERKEKEEKKEIQKDAELP